MSLELEQYHKSGQALELMLNELRLKAEGLRKELNVQVSISRSISRSIGIRLTEVQGSEVRVSLPSLCHGVCLSVMVILARMDLGLLSYPIEWCIIFLDSSDLLLIICHLSYSVISLISHNQYPIY